MHLPLKLLSSICLCNNITVMGTIHFGHDLVIARKGSPIAWQHAVDMLKPEGVPGRSDMIALLTMHLTDCPPDSMLCDAPVRQEACGRGAIETRGVRHLPRDS